MSDELGCQIGLEAETWQWFRKGTNGKDPEDHSHGAFLSNPLGCSGCTVSQTSFSKQNRTSRTRTQSCNLWCATDTCQTMETNGLAIWKVPEIGEPKVRDNPLAILFFVLGQLQGETPNTTRKGETQLLAGAKAEKGSAIPTRLHLLRWFPTNNRNAGPVLPPLFETNPTHRTVKLGEENKTNKTHTHTHQNKERKKKQHCSPS